LLKSVEEIEFSLKQVSSLYEARPLLQEGTFDVILLDLSLPDGFGLSVLTEVRAQAPGIPIVVLTGEDDEALGLQAVQAGAQDYLIKGEVESKRLARSMRYAVERHRASPQLRRSEAKHHIFLSYSRKDTAVMQRLLDDLRAAALKVWVDEEGLEPGTPAWEQAIRSAIQQSGCVVVILSPDAEKSTWVGRELAMAETLEKRIFPALARGSEKDAIPLRLMSHQWVDMRHNYAEALEKLLASVKKYLAS
jgi:CheY-like chemotaxis protein